MTRHSPPSNHNVLNERLTLAAGCAAFLLTILWEGNNIAIKFALAGVPSFALAGIRFVLGFFIVLTLLFQRYIASRVGVFQFITPVFGVVFSNLLLGERLSFGLVASMVLVGTGIAIVNCQS